MKNLYTNTWVFR